MIYTDDIVINYLNQIGNSNPTENQIEFARNGLKNALALKLLRKERDRRLTSTDWWVLPDRTATDEELTYRQALRDITDLKEHASVDEEGNLLFDEWPVNPNIVVDDPFA
jgi:hypothetical protein